MTMFKKSNSLVFNTSNSSFEELYNFLTYKSSSTHLKKITFISSEGIFKYSGVRTVKVPLSDKFGAPSEIDILITGTVDSNGNSKTVYSIPEKYKSYIDVTETIYILKNGSIRVNLKYTVYGMESDGTIMGAIKSKAYDSMISSTEDHVMSIYTSKRNICFSNTPLHKINTLEEFMSYFHD